MAVLGIDPGTHCGWCVMSLSGEPVSGTWQLADPKRRESEGMRFIRLRRELRAALAKYEPALVAFEEVRNHKGVRAAHIYGGIIAHVTEMLDTQGIAYTSIPVGVVKKRATGKGNAGKDQMMAACRTQWPGWSGDDNEADARWIAMCALDDMKKEAQEALG